MSDSLTASMSLSDMVGRAGVLQRAGDMPGAATLYAEWIAGNGTHPLLFAALFNQSTVLQDIGRLDDAKAALTRCLQLNADFVPGYINLGRLLENTGSPDKALELWYQGAARPVMVSGQAVFHAVTILKQMARVHMDREETEEAEQVLARCLAIDPGQTDALEQYLAMRMRELKRPVLADLESLTVPQMLSRFHPLSVAAYTDDPLLQLASANAYQATVLGPNHPVPVETDRRAATIDLTNRRLRVGYLSSDLRDHAIGYLLAEFFELQDRATVEVFAYATGPAPLTAITDRIRAAVEHWVDIRALSDDEATRRIAADGIDILVDVNGHTRDGRLGVLARRPAPIIVNWLGFPGTMGTPFHHYIVADPFIIPETSEIYVSETVMRLPCYQANDRKRMVAPRPTREACGLPEKAFVFCTFNALHKFTAFTTARWFEILRAVPDSVLWLLDGTTPAKARLAEQARAAGVDPSRLIHATKLQNAFHLARYPLADLVIDAIPYGAHTTASDALFMGVPVLTLAGRCFASRVCGSLVSAAGLPDFVVTDPQAYVARAIELARTPALLAEARARLGASRESCTLFDQPGLVRALHGLYLEMVARHQSGRTPVPQLANLPAYLAATVTHDHETTELTFIPDYHERVRERLAVADRRQPLVPDGRLWPPDAPRATVPSRPVAKARRGKRA